MDVLQETVDLHGDATAIDSGTEQLTYDELAEAVSTTAAELNAHGIGPGDRVGVRAKSGTTSLYAAILGVLAAGAAYVPVDADDPDDRARLVFGEADVAAILGNDLAVVHRRAPGPARQASGRDPRTTPG